MCLCVCKCFVYVNVCSTVVFLPLLMCVPVVRLRDFALPEGVRSESCVFFLNTRHARNVPSGMGFSLNYFFFLLFYSVIRYNYVFWLLFDSVAGAIAIKCSSTLFYFFLFIYLYPTKIMSLSYSVWISFIPVCV